MTLSQARTIRSINRLFMARRAAGDDALGLLWRARETLGTDCHRVLKAQMEVSWPLPVLHSLSRVLMSI